jgi:hypothetical protein
VGKNGVGVRLLSAAAMAAALAIAAPAAAQRQIITGAVSNSDVRNDESEVSLSFLAGALASTNMDGTDARALTDYGVNKVFARGTAETETAASSAWLDTFTVGGAAGSVVRTSFSFTVDGAVGGSQVGGAEWNYKVFALRGGGWSINGGDGDTSDQYFKYLGTGGDYDSLVLKNVVANPNGRVTLADMRDFDGFYNHANVDGEAGQIMSQVWRQVDGLGEYFEVTSPAGGNVITTKYYAGFFQRRVNTTPFQTFQYTNTQAGGPQSLAVRNSLVANYSLLAVGGLCDNAGCRGLTQNMTQIDPFTFTLEFDLLAGSVFTLASWMYADDVKDATIDLFNTAKVTGVTVSNGGTLTSASGALQALPGGGFGYPAALDSAVPEPGTWVTLIVGFGMIGGALRQRRRAVLA